MKKNVILFFAVFLISSCVDDGYEYDRRGIQGSLRDGFYNLFDEYLEEPVYAMNGFATVDYYESLSDSAKRLSPLRDSIETYGNTISLKGVGTYSKSAEEGVWLYAPAGDLYYHDYYYDYCNRTGRIISIAPPSGMDGEWKTYFNYKFSGENDEDGHFSFSFKLLMTSRIISEDDPSNGYFTWNVALSGERDEDNGWASIVSSRDSIKCSWYNPSGDPFDSEATLFRPVGTFHSDFCKNGKVVDYGDMVCSEMFGKSYKMSF
ncbi:MAG: hypothetical protein LKI42_05230 [Bacteroidales bacterium]|jgi:hypothetical protein|nr:hypothetical protein [Bacteroidales bacterium]MCI1785051.1 hypothetical protein [Bacteroidales bacterium]